MTALVTSEVWHVGLPKRELVSRLGGNYGAQFELWRNHMRPSFSAAEESESSGVHSAPLRTASQQVTPERHRSLSRVTAGTIEDLETRTFKRYMTESSMGEKAFA